MPSSRLQNSIWRLFLSSGAIAALIWSGSYTIARSQSTPSAPALTPATTTPPRFITLRLGAEGYLVAEVQAILKLLGYYTGAIDGRFQESTATAVAAFQRAAGLTPDGIVGINTWNRLIPNSTIAASPTPASPIASSPPASPSPTPTPTPTPAASPTPAAAASPTPTPTASTAASVDFPILRLGMRGSAVTRLQERLRSTGFYSGAIDGVFGPQTQAAVQAAQRRFGLTPDGVVGSATWGALLR
ncbi:peptidoglycan-binding protein [Microcoleus sp. FACHB-1515]|uniref:peptidoglycan-binding protein n=1 Tax=Cyanophyceae TaxID=3028117 RepID=UPI0016895144|nr:peptidoglycan-binding protein [Microcoleus sp. FACHB-1515]MBD2092306.1 peptidoglycan-binding protein [Microcoleus sp. FACHB-1515]